LRGRILVLDAKIREVFVGHLPRLVILVVFDAPWKGTDDLVLVADVKGIR